MVRRRTCAVSNHEVRIAYPSRRPRCGLLRMRSEYLAYLLPIKKPTPIAATLSVIAAVESHPSQYSGPPTTKRPITSLCRAMIISSTITGTASTPLTTALQYSAEIGLIEVKLSAIPMAADSASTE